MPATLTPIGVLAMAMGSLTLASAAQAQKQQGPCQQIRAACLAAGFAAGKAK